MRTGLDVLGPALLVVAVLIVALARVRNQVPGLAYRVQPRRHRVVDAVRVHFEVGDVGSAFVLTLGVDVAERVRDCQAERTAGSRRELATGKISCYVRADSINS